jgi:hypothetical protein
LAVALAGHAKLELSDSNHLLEHEAVCRTFDLETVCKQTAAPASSNRERNATENVRRSNFGND